MARIRSAKPEFWTDPLMCALPRDVRFTFKGIWEACADDEGRFLADARMLKSAIWPMDDDISVKKVEAWTVTLAEHGRILLYTIAGVRYGVVANWSKHQKVSHKLPSRIPAAPERRRNGSGAPPESGTSGAGEPPEGRRLARADGDVDVELDVDLDLDVDEETPPADIEQRFLAALPKSKLPQAYAAEFSAWRKGLHLPSGMVATDADVTAALTDYLAQANPSFDLPHLRGFIRRAVTERRRGNDPQRALENALGRKPTIGEQVFLNAGGGK